MGVCKRNGSDPLLKALVGKGINIVLPPRVGLKAGDLIIADKDGASRSADWKVVLGVDPPLRGKTEPTFESQSFDVSNELGMSAGASLVGRALAVFGLQEGALSGALQKTGATQLNIQLTAPAVSRLTNLDEVLEALRAAGAMPRKGYEDRRLLVVEQAWRARGLSLELLDQRGGHVAVNAEVIEQLQAEAKLQVTNRGDGRITFVAEAPLIFGVTLRELEITLDGVRDSAPKDHFAFRGGSGEADYAVLSDDLLVDLGPDEAA